MLGLDKNNMAMGHRILTFFNMTGSLMGFMTGLHSGISSFMFYKMNKDEFKSFSS